MDAREVRETMNNRLTFVSVQAFQMTERLSYGTVSRIDLCPIVGHEREELKPMMVSKGSVVSVEYTLRLDNQEVFESNVGDDPLTYTHGQEEIISGLERGLEGMTVGENKTVIVMPSDGYGEIHQEGLFEVSRDRIPADALQIGTKLETQAPDGTPVFPYVAEIKADTVVLNLNHPLAGQKLHFEVRVLMIKNPTSLSL